MSVLRDTAFGDVELRHDLNTGDKRRMNIFLKRDVIHHRAVNTHADKRILLKRLNMNVGCIFHKCLVEKAVDKIDDRSVVGAG